MEKELEMFINGSEIIMPDKYGPTLYGFTINTNAFVEDGGHNYIGINRYTPSIIEGFSPQTHHDATIKSIEFDLDCDKFEALYNYFKLKYKAMKEDQQQKRRQRNANQ